MPLSVMTYRSGVAFAFFEVVVASPPAVGSNDAPSVVVSVGGVAQRIQPSWRQRCAACLPAAVFGNRPGVVLPPPCRGSPVGLAMVRLSA